MQQASRKAESGNHKHAVNDTIDTIFQLLGWNIVSMMIRRNEITKYKINE